MEAKLGPDEYLMQVKKLAVLMARCRKLEKGGHLRAGWFEARRDLMKELRSACITWKGMDFDLMDDAAQMVIDAARRGR